jgi:hypothetical protein
MTDETRSLSGVRIDDRGWGRYVDIPLACPRNRERYTQNKSLAEIQHAVDQGTASDSSAGGPDPSVRYVINPNNPAEVIDMRHFLVVGPKGESFGLLVELAQLLADNKSAFDAQDFLSNYLGSEFFRTYNANRALGDQLKQFFRSRKRK